MPRPIPSTWRFSRSCSGFWSAGTIAFGRTNAVSARTTATATCSAATVVFGLAVGNHSLTLLLAVPVGLYVLAVEPGIWRRGRLVLGCVAALALTVVARLSRAAAPRRTIPCRARLRHPEHTGRLQLHRPGRAIPERPVRPVR